MVRVLIVEDQKIMQKYFEYIILQNPVLRTIRVVNNDATDYDWNGGGSFIRNTAIQIEKKRTGLKESMGFKTYYYGVGYLNK